MQRSRSRSLRLGDKWFVVSELWWGRVVESGGGAPASDSDSDDNGQQLRADLTSARIQNDRLVDRSRSCRCCSSSMLKPGLVEGVDYRLVSERVWRALALEFGYDWEICRPVVSRSGVFGGRTELTIDMYPANLQGHEGIESPEYPPKEDGYDKMETEAQAPEDNLDEPWRQELQPGHMLDALDTDNKWYEARVVEASANQVKVHYRGWSTRWDEWIDRDSRRLMPLHTKVREWRKFRVDDSVQVGVSVSGTRRLEWRDATVLATTDTLLVQLSIDNGRIEWVDAQDERLCPPGTHRVHSTAPNFKNERKRARTNSDTDHENHSNNNNDSGIDNGSYSSNNALFGLWL